MLQKTLSDVPVDAIRDALTRCPEVIVKVARQNSRGQWASVASNIRKQTAELMQLDDWLMARGGGGRYRIAAHDPKDPTTEVVPAFTIEIEGPPHPATFMQEEMAPGAMPVGYQSMPMQPPTPGYGGSPYAPPPMAPRPMPAPSPWVSGLAPSQQAAFMPQMHMGFDPNQRYNQPLNRYTPDELAKQTADRMEKELGEVRKELAAVRKEYESKIETLNLQLLEARTTAREREFEARMQALTAQIQQQQNQKPQTDLFDKVVALTPLLQAWMTVNKDREGLATSQQTKMLELLVTKKDESNGTLAVIEKLSPFLAPLLTKLFDSRGPEAQAKLIEQMSEQQLTFLGMAAQLVQSQIEAEAEAEGAKGKLIPVLEQVLGGAMQLGQAWLQGKQFDDLEQLPPELRRNKLKAMGLDEASIEAIDQEIRLKQTAQLQRSQPMQQLIQTVTQQAPRPQAPVQAVPTPQDQRQAEVVHQAEVVADIAETLTPDENERIRKADVLVQQQLKSPLVPQAFKTAEWSRILVLIHAELDPAGVAEELATHIDELAEQDKLPEPLASFHDNPRATLAKLFAFMPIQKSSPAYVKQLLDAIDTLYEPTAEQQAEAQAETEAMPTLNLEPMSVGQG